MSYSKWGVLITNLCLVFFQHVRFSRKVSLKFFIENAKNTEKILIETIFNRKLNCKIELIIQKQSSIIYFREALVFFLIKSFPFSPKTAFCSFLFMDFCERVPLQGLAVISHHSNIQSSLITSLHLFYVLMRKLKSLALKWNKLRNIVFIKYNIIRVGFIIILKGDLF